MFSHKLTFQQGQVIGYLAGYFLFTTALFLVLLGLHKLPNSGSYFYVSAITLLLTMGGLVLRWWLK